MLDTFEREPRLLHPSVDADQLIVLVMRYVEQSYGQDHQTSIRLACTLINRLFNGGKH